MSGPRASAAQAELELLRESARCALPGVTASAAFPALLGRVNWHHVLWRGRFHRALLFLRDALAALEPAQRPTAPWAHLNQLHETNQFRMMERERELHLITHRLEEAGISVVAMNGWGFAQRHYPNPVLREVGAATELLIEPADRARAEQTLKIAGYTFGQDLLRLEQSRRSHVELATSLCGDEGVHPIPLARIRARAAVVSVGGRALPILAARDWLYHLAWKGAQTLHAQLRLSFEISLLVLRQPELDWPDVLAEARQVRLEAAVLLGLQVAHELFALRLPEAVLARLAEKSSVRRRAVRRVDAWGDAGCESWFTLRNRLAVQETWPAKLKAFGHFVGGAVRPTRFPVADTELAYIGRFAPTPPRVVRAMLLLAGVTSEDVVYDLGCGDGRVVIRAAKDFGARGVGIDIDPVRIAAAREFATTAGVTERVTLTCADVLRTPITGATIVCIYLQGFAYPVLRRKLERELPRGTRVISHNFIFPGWPPEKTEIIRTQPWSAAHIYLWRT